MRTQYIVIPAQVTPVGEDNSRRSAIGFYNVKDVD